MTLSQRRRIDDLLELRVRVRGEPPGGPDIQLDDGDFALLPLVDSFAPEARALLVSALREAWREGSANISALSALSDPAATFAVHAYRDQSKDFDLAIDVQAEVLVESNHNQDAQRMERAYQAVSGRLHQVAGLNPLGMVVLDPKNLDILQLNHRAVELLNLPDADACGLKIGDVINNFEPQRMAARFQDHDYQSRGSVTFERQLELHNGAILHARLSARLFEIRGQRRALFAIEDMAESGERRDALVDLMEQASAMQGACLYEAVASRLATILDVDAFAVVEHDTNGRSGSTRAWWQNGQLSKNYVYRLSGTPCERLLSEREAVWARSVARAFPDDEALADLGAEGYIGVALRDPEGKTIGHLAAITCNEIVGIEESLSVLRMYAPLAAGEMQREKMRQDMLRVQGKMQQAQKLESLGLLAGGIAHDFNNLLTSVIGHVELAQSRAPGSAEAFDDLRQISRSASRAAELCSQMLAFAGKGRYAVHNVAVGEFVREIVQLLDVSISKQAELKLDLSAELPPVRADTSQLTQVILNLVTNGSDALGGHAGTIVLRTDLVEVDAGDTSRSTISELSPGSYVRIEVSDTGCGMPPEMIEQMFDPFFSTKATGRGLGLSAVLGIVRSHDGGISVDSKPGQGTCVRIYLPALTGGLLDQVTSVTNPTHLKGQRILVVDDEDPVREVSAEMLDHLGAEVVQAGGGERAIALLDQPNEVTMALLDVTMPGLDGADTLRAIRELHPDLPVVMMSGYNDPEVTQELIDLGANAFIQKPFTLDKLRECMGNVRRH